VAHWNSRSPGAGQRQSRHLPAYYARAPRKGCTVSIDLPVLPVGRP
jgi:hypothetical protein